MEEARRRILSGDIAFAYSISGMKESMAEDGDKRAHSLPRPASSTSNPGSSEATLLAESPVSRRSWRTR